MTDSPLQFANSLADASGAIIRRRFRQKINVEIKGDNSPVSDADRETESELRRLIGEAFPAHGVIGEEYGADRPDAEFVWVLDPIDGTKSFITGRPLFGTLIALCHNGAPILGIIDHPAINERWTGAAGQPTRFNDAPGAGAILQRHGRRRHVRQLTAFQDAEQRGRLRPRAPGGATGAV